MTIVLKLMVMLVAAVLASGAGAQADPNKVLRVVFRIAETGFDPPAVSDLYSNFVNRVLFDTPFRFDFPARPHKGELDYLDVPTDLVPNVMEPNNTLKPRFAKAGVVLERGVQPSITYTFFNMNDGVVAAMPTTRSRYAGPSAWATTWARVRLESVETSCCWVAMSV